MVNEATNQVSRQDAQNFEIDIDKIYTDFIKEIDAVRSIVDISTEENISKFKNLTEEAVSKLSSTLKAETTAQESRCHAFYRLIGFPVLSNDKKMYNPGLNIIKEEKDITFSTQVAIAKTPIDGFYDLSLKRETYINKINKIFSLNTSINSAVLTLSSINTRNFISSFEKDDSKFDTEPKNQEYEVDFTSIVGQNLLDLNEYVDVKGNKPTSDVFMNRAHYIKPFLVDPRIDFSVNPAKNKIAVPFVPTKTELKVSETEFTKRPLIEKVIRDRLSVRSLNTVGLSDQALIDYIKNNDVIKDENIINQISSGIYNLSEQQQFVKFLHIIRAMMLKLVAAQQIIQKVQGLYYFLPIPSKTGPENGSTYHPVFLNVPNNLMGYRDLAIIKAVTNVALSQINSLVSENSVTDIGDFAFDSFKTTFSSETTEALGNSSSKSLEELNSERDYHLKKACSSLRTIEIIMGEFSGLGLCDIVAIMGSLYLIPLEDLLGFLDVDAYNRMKVALKLTEESLIKSDIDTSLNTFTSTVKDFYTLMDKIYQDILNNNG